MSSQIIPLKSRVDLRETSRILATETIRVRGAAPVIRSSGPAASIPRPRAHVGPKVIRRRQNQQHHCAVSLLPILGRPTICAEAEALRSQPDKADARRAAAEVDPTTALTRHVFRLDRWPSGAAGSCTARVAPHTR